MFPVIRIGSRSAVGKLRPGDQKRPFSFLIRPFNRIEINIPINQFGHSTTAFAPFLQCFQSHFNKVLQMLTSHQVLLTGCMIVDIRVVSATQQLVWIVSRPKGMLLNCELLHGC